MGSWPEVKLRRVLRRVFFSHGLQFDELHYLLFLMRMQIILKKTHSDAHIISAVSLPAFDQCGGWTGKCICSGEHTFHSDSEGLPGEWWEPFVQVRLHLALLHF